MARQQAGDIAGGIAILVAAAVLGIAILLGAAPAMAWLTPRLGAGFARNAPLADTLFNIVVFAPILLVALIGGAVDRRNAAALGTRAAGGLAFGCALGLAGISVAAAYAKLAGTLAPVPGTAGAPLLLAWGLAVVVLQTFAEEVYFRGWLQPSLHRRWGLAPALIATSLVFAGLHVAGGARSPVSILNLFLGGLTFGMLAARGGGVAAAFATHFAWNAAEQLGYGLDPNPGVGSFGSIRDWDLIGPELWGGSVEGLNASLGMTFVMLASVVPLVILSGRALWGSGHRAAPRRVVVAL